MDETMDNGKIFTCPDEQSDNYKYKFSHDKWKLIDCRQINVLLFVSESSSSIFSHDDKQQ